MKINSTVVAVVMIVVVVISGSCMLEGAVAQTVNCLSVAGSEAPFADASSLVQQVLLMPGPCCQGNQTAVCSVILTVGNAAASVCGAYNYCPNCSDVGNGINMVLAQCVTLQNQVLGCYSPDGTNDHYFYITSASQPP